MKTKVAIIGSGNIGMDLMYKVRKNPALEMGMLVGLDNDSPRLAMAAELGIPVSKQGIQAIVDNPDSCEIVFDATTAKAHLVHGPILEKLGKRTIDLTPAAIGLQVVPVINLEEGLKTSNVNLISCGGQAVLGLVWAINKVSPVTYAEVINASASRGVGMGTRKNIDEYTEVTTECLMTVAGAKSGKAIIVINPAEPPIIMHNTVFAVVEALDERNAKEIAASLLDVIKQIQGYVPGYRMTAAPQFDYERKLVTVMVEIQGAGDYLPPYSGNLDIINQAAITIAEGYAAQLRRENGAS